MQRRVARPLRVVLVRDWGAEERHDAVARELVHRPLEAMHTRGENGEEAIDDVVPLLGIELLGKLHRALHISEEHGDLLSLALQGGTGAENLLGEVRRGIGCGRSLSESRSSRQRGAAAPAELLARLDGPAARRTRAAEAAPTLRAEAAVRAVAVTARRAAERAANLHELSWSWEAELAPLLLHGPQVCQRLERRPRGARWAGSGWNPRLELAHTVNRTPSAFAREHIEMLAAAR